MRPPVDGASGQIAAASGGRKRATAIAVKRALLLLAATAACGGGDDVGPSPADATIAIPDALVGDPPDAPPMLVGEMRGVWITRYAYNDAAMLEGIIDRAAGANFNAVFVQIRGEGDAFYQSTLEPWARKLTGVLGRDPGWDPLQVAIDRARMHGIEIHAYFNALSAWPATSEVAQAEGPVQHALYEHPDWLAVDSSGTNTSTEYRWFSPGNPAVRAHVVAVARDLLSRYDVDGLHLDRIRTPGPDYSRDATTVAAYEAALVTEPTLAWDDFMRRQIDVLVSDLDAAVAELRPDAQLSASVWGIYERLPGCSTSWGYGQYYQDSIGWMESGAIDAIAPMMYWPIEPGACTDWATLLDGFVARRGQAQVWAGMHALDDNAWAFDQVAGRIDYARTGGAQGVMVFASTYLDQGADRWAAFPGTPPAPGPFAEPSPTPHYE
jgi:uncharacterized lipoprotein YddW (UPF0748 family)